MIKAIIIDDELRAQRVLKNLIESYCEEVEVLACCNDVPSAVIKINQLNPDVVFCDIEMPQYTGLELVSFFQEVNFELIFATGYSEFAIKAFELSAIDYLLKPIQIDKLEAAIEKVRTKLQHESMNDRLETLKTNLKETEITKIALPVADGLIFILVNNIILCEAAGAYSNVYLNDGSKILISKKLKFFEALLGPKNQFYRIHRSSIININYITKYIRSEGYLHLENDKSVKVARDKKNEFEEYIANIKL